jgi:hypothetical protein
MRLLKIELPMRPWSAKTMGDLGVSSCQGRATVEEMYALLLLVSVVERYDIAVVH